MLKLFLYLHLIVFCSAAFAKNPVILISIDGFAHKYLDAFQPSFINSMRKQGVSSKGLKPVYPSKTFPNHLSIVTGKYPVEHGIVHNKFYHRSIGKNYTLGAGKFDSRWLLAEPIWTIAERKGVKSAVYFWPESEAEVSGIKPSYYYDYKHNTPNKKRLDQLIEWLKLPKNKRPKLLVTYFSTVDSAGHKYGTKSDNLKREINKIDNLLSEFYQRLHAETDSTPNIILVSDHGMVDVNQNTSMLAERLFLPFPDIKYVNGETQLYVYEQNTKSLNCIKEHLEALPQAANFKVYLKNDFPSHWRFNLNTAFLPDLIVEAKAPSVFYKSANKDMIHKGTHGFDPRNNSDLDAIFIALGPDIKKETLVPKFQNVLVFDIVAKLLHLESSDIVTRKEEEKVLNLIIKGLE